MREQIERRAERVLAAVPDWIWDGQSLPVPVEQITDSCHSLLVRDVEDLSAAPGAPAVPPGSSLSGLLLPGRGEIWVNAQEAREWPGRRRFTIGHELGHWCMHREGGGAIYCRSASVAEAEEGARPARLPEEREANMFAAALLMPARLVRLRHARNQGFAALCAAFDVSGAAMERRLRALLVDPAR